MSELEPSLPTEDEGPGFGTAIGALAIIFASVATAGAAGYVKHRRSREAADPKTPEPIDPDNS